MPSSRLWHLPGHRSAQVSSPCRLLCPQAPGFLLARCWGNLPTGQPWFSVLLVHLPLSAHCLLSLLSADIQLLYCNTAMSITLVFIVFPGSACAVAGPGARQSADSGSHPPCNRGPGPCVSMFTTCHHLPRMEPLSTDRTFIPTGAPSAYDAFSFLKRRTSTFPLRQSPLRLLSGRSGLPISLFLRFGAISKDDLNTGTATP